MRPDWRRPGGRVPCELFVLAQMFCSGPGISSGPNTTAQEPAARAPRSSTQISAGHGSRAGRAPWWRPDCVSRRLDTKFQPAALATNSRRPTRALGRQVRASERAPSWRAHAHSPGAPAPPHPCALACACPTSGARGSPSEVPVSIRDDQLESLTRRAVSQKFARLPCHRVRRPRTSSSHTERVRASSRSA